MEAQGREALQQRAVTRLHPRQVGREAHRHDGGVLQRRRRAARRRGRVGGVDKHVAAPPEQARDELLQQVAIAEKLLVIICRYVQVLARVGGLQAAQRREGGHWRVVRSR